MVGWVVVPGCVARWKVPGCLVMVGEVVSLVVLLVWVVGLTALMGQALL